MTEFIFLLAMIVSQHSQYIYQQKSLELRNGSSVRYCLADPEESIEKDSVLLLVLHWGWDRSQPVPEYYGERFLKDFVMSPLHSSGFRPLILAPDCPSRIWHCEESEEALLQLIDTTMSKYGIKENQLIVMGYSAGGIGTWYFCSRNQDRIKICIPAASLPEEDWISNWHIKRTYILQAELDDLFPLEHIKTVERKLKKKPDIPNMSVVRGAGHYDTAQFGQILESLFMKIKKESREE